VVQLYINDNVASLTRPVRELKGFKLIELAPGESKEVSFEISATDLAFINHDLQRRAEKGGFTLWIAPSSVTGEAVGFELV